MSTIDHPWLCACIFVAIGIHYFLVSGGLDFMPPSFHPEILVTVYGYLFIAFLGLLNNFV